MVKQVVAKTQKHGVGGLRINVPSKIQSDSLNPIVAGENVSITVDGKQMTITPLGSTASFQEQQEARVKPGQAAGGRNR